VAVVLTLVQTRQIVNIHKRKSTKNTVQTIETVNRNIHTTKTPTHCKTYTDPHIRKQLKITTVQVKTNTVQDLSK